MPEDMFPWEDVDACRGQAAPDEENARLPKLRAKGSRCPMCRTLAADLTWVYFVSPASMWEALCGRAGWMSICDACRVQVDFDLSIMN